MAQIQDIPLELLDIIFKNIYLMSEPGRSHWYGPGFGIAEDDN